MTIGRRGFVANGANRICHIIIVSIGNALSVVNAQCIEFTQSRTFAEHSLAARTTDVRRLDGQFILISLTAMTEQLYPYLVYIYRIIASGQVY
ncbi:hypothetical protein D4Q85_01070 [bacterium]|nr:MAG: hypothetical protein D4Q85_01070 [bacterium]